jgi:UDP-glucose 6-dehydrogenase
MNRKWNDKGLGKNDQHMIIEFIKRLNVFSNIYVNISDLHEIIDKSISDEFCNRMIKNVSQNILKQNNIISQVLSITQYISNPEFTKLTSALQDKFTDIQVVFANLNDAKEYILSNLKSKNDEADQKLKQMIENGFSMIGTLPNILQNIIPSIK